MTVLQFTDDAYSEYDALTVKMNKRFSHNYQFMASYTWSKSYDNDSNETSTELYGYDYPENVYDLAAEWGPSDFDIQHRFVASGVYQFAELLNLPDWYELEIRGIFDTAVCEGGSGDDIRSCERCECGTFDDVRIRRRFSRSV